MSCYIFDKLKAVCYSILVIVMLHISEGEMAAHIAKTELIALSLCAVSFNSVSLYTSVGVYSLSLLALSISVLFYFLFLLYFISTSNLSFLLLLRLVSFYWFYDDSIVLLSFLRLEYSSWT